MVAATPPAPPSVEGPLPRDVCSSVDPGFTVQAPPFAGDSGFFLQPPTVAADPALPDHLYAGTIGGLFASLDAGATWQQVEGVEGRVTTVVLAPEGGRLFAQTETGVAVVPFQA